jgi:hypothetical protein
MRRVVLAGATGSVEAVRGNVAEVRFDTGARCPVPLVWLSPAPGCAECCGPIKAKRSTPEVLLRLLLRRVSNSGLPV